MVASEYEQVCYWRRCLATARALSDTTSPTKEGLNEPILARHKSFARAKISQDERAEADRALLAEVDNCVEGGGFLPPWTKHLGGQTV